MIERFPWDGNQKYSSNVASILQLVKATFNLKRYVKYNFLFILLVNFMYICKQGD